MTRRHPNVALMSDSRRCPKGHLVDCQTADDSVAVVSNTTVISPTGTVWRPSCRTRHGHCYLSTRRCMKGRLVDCRTADNSVAVVSNTTVGQPAQCRRVRHDSDTTTPQCRSRVGFDGTGGRRGTAVEFDTTVKRRRAGCSVFLSTLVLKCCGLLGMDREGKPSKRRTSAGSGSMEQSPKKRKGTPTAGVGVGDTPGSKGHRTPVLRGAPSMGTPSAHVRGSGPDSAVLMSDGAAGREEEATGRLGKSAMDVVLRRKRSGDTSAADNIVPIGGVVKWSRGNSQFAMLELTMVLNARGERIADVKRVALRWAKHAGYGKRLYDIFNPPGTEKLTLSDLRSVFASFDRHVVAGHKPVVHASDRISEPKSVFSSSLEAGPSSKPIIIGARPPPSIRTTVAATRVPKSGQIGEKGPCRGQIVLSAPVKRRPTSTKEPVSLVRPPRYELAIPAGSHYFGDDDEENSEEEWERDEERKEYEEGDEEEEVESEYTISERGGPDELEGCLGVEYEDEGQEEETIGEGGYADVHRGRGEMHREVGVEPAHDDAVRLAEKKRKMRQERRRAMDSKKTQQEGGTKQKEGKRKLKMLAVEEAVQRMREAEEAMKKKRQPRKKAAKGGVMEKTSVFPPDQPQSDEDIVCRTVTRPPGLQILPHGNSSSHLSKGFFLEFDENGNQRPEMQFISVKLDRILDIPDEEFRYNQRFLDQELIDDLYKTMVESGEIAIRERTIGAAGVNVCALYEKPVLLLIGLHDTMHTDASGTNVRARKVTPREFDLQSVRKYYWYPLSGQHNVAAARKCSQERPDIARELRLDCWTARPVYYPDRSMENYCTLSTFQNAKDKWNTPPHQIAIIKNIRKLWQAAGRPEAIGGSAADVKNKDYIEFAAMALRATGSDHLVTLSLQPWSKEWSDVLGSYMILARATDDVFEKVQQVYFIWESGQLPGRDGVKPATEQGESGKAPGPGPGFELEKGVRVPVHWIQGTRGPGYLMAVRDPDVRSWKAMSTLRRRERLQLLRDILTGCVVLAPRLSKAANTVGKHSMETYVEMRKQERAMLRMFHYFVFISDPHKKPSEWKEPFFDNLSDLFARYSDHELTSERWIDQRRHFKETSWVRSFPATLGDEDEKGEEGFKKTKSLANKCPEKFIQFVNKLLRRSETGGSHSIRMSEQARYIHFQKQDVASIFVPFQWEPNDVSDEMDCKEMFRAVRHLTCYTAVLDLCHPTQMGTWSEQVFAGLKKFMDKLGGEYWTLLCFVPRPCKFIFLRRVAMWDIQLDLLKWTRLQQTKGKVYKIANLSLEDTDRMVVIMYSNDGDFHRNTIPLFEDIQAAGPAPAERVVDILTLVRRERKPKMLTYVVENNFLPSKWKMTGMDPPEKVVYDGMEREPNAMVETLEHFCPGDEAVVFLGKGHAGLVWELLKSHRHCIVLEGEGMKFEFLIQFIDKMVKTRDYHANFTKPPPRHDEGRDLVYKVGQNMVNIWEFLFETQPQDRGERTYVLRRRKVEKVFWVIIKHHRRRRFHFSTAWRPCTLTNKSGRLQSQVMRLVLWMVRTSMPTT
ncbi:hypothetical protein CBR_g5685 [Chara braunii]|uniref:Uncharacterized protein n=1 Tax=Chara braunii TaxID=69332 RepID=A0A388JRR7_CHABU|nr:hypothetical protein CBR_g5685 [Chara braunii]|eukprot:GBG60509.1 hypothetical protein CBR_g5685 [Chara braunii]